MPITVRLANSDLLPTTFIPMMDWLTVLCVTSPLKLSGILSRIHQVFRMDRMDGRAVIYWERSVYGSVHILSTFTFTTLKYLQP